MKPGNKNSHATIDMSTLVANQINAMLAYWDENLICRFANDAYLEWFGRTKEEMVNKMTIQELLGPDLYSMNLPYISEALKGNKQVFEREIPTPDCKSIRHSLATYFPHIVEGQVKGFFVHVADVSYIKELEALLSKMRLDMLRNAIETQEEERAYLEKQLRDNINQTLTHCRLLLQAKNVNGYENAIDKKLLRGIDKAINELNLLSIDLIPSTVQDFGFIQGTKSYIENTVQDLPVEFTCKNEQIEELNLPIKFLLFRIIQGFLSILYDQKNKNAVAITVNYQNNTITMELAIADEDFVFHSNEKAYMDIIKRVQYFGSEVEETRQDNEKLFRIRIAI